MPQVSLRVDLKPLADVDEVSVLMQRVGMLDGVELVTVIPGGAVDLDLTRFESTARKYVVTSDGERRRLTPLERELFRLLVVGTWRGSVLTTSQRVLDLLHCDPACKIPTTTTKSAILRAYKGLCEKTDTWGLPGSFVRQRGRYGFVEDVA